MAKLKNGGGRIAEKKSGKTFIFFTRPVTSQVFPPPPISITSSPAVGRARRRAREVPRPGGARATALVAEFRARSVRHGGAVQGALSARSPAAHDADVVSAAARALGKRAD